jgi:hypothetical protein
MSVHRGLRINRSLGKRSPSRRRSMHSAKEVVGTVNPTNVLSLRHQMARSASIHDQCKAVYGQPLP